MSTTIEKLKLAGELLRKAVDDAEIRKRESAMPARNVIVRAIKDGELHAADADGECVHVVGKVSRAVTPSCVLLTRKTADGAVAESWLHNGASVGDVVRRALSMSSLLADGESLVASSMVGVDKAGNKVFLERAEVCAESDQSVCAQDGAQGGAQGDGEDYEYTGGAHEHDVRRDVGRTEYDGEHDHSFVLKLAGNTVVFSFYDGAHEHAVSEGAQRTSKESEHAHSLVLSESERRELASLLLLPDMPALLVTSAGTEHDHELGVDETSADGRHQHVLKLPEGSVLTSMTAEEVASAMASSGDAVSKSDTVMVVGVRKEAPTSDMTDQEARDARDRRSLEFGITVLDSGSSLRWPAGFPTTLEEYGDPVNLKYPVDTKERAANARARFKQNAGAYTDDESRSAVHERIVSAELGFGVVPSFDPEDPLDALLSDELKGALTDRAGAQKSAGRSVRMVKSEDGPERFIFGVVLVPGEVDAQGDIYSADEVRKAAHGYMQHFGGVLRVMHDGVNVPAAKVVETYLTRSEETYGEETFPVGTWMLGSKLDKSEAGDRLWKQVESGEFTGYSIGGTAVKERLAQGD